jgi:hypothetical protein
MCVDWGVGYYSTHVLWPCLFGVSWCGVVALSLGVINLWYPQCVGTDVALATTGFCVCRGTGCPFSVHCCPVCGVLVLTVS